ncbi:MAG: hypothetical protein HY882_15625 [Deltaproteobacteria bacterium]|nr:hypothetical protein [Deltaproteobacteria bacterium]
MAIKKREKILILFVGIAIAIWAFDRFYYVPQKRKIMELEEQVRAADLKLNELFMYTKGVESAEAEVSRLEKELQGFKKRTLGGEEFRAFLRHLAKDSDRLQMKIVSLSPQEEKSSPPEGKKVNSAVQYKRVTVQMVLSSTFSALGAYLRGIEELPFLVTLESLQVERNEKILPFLIVTMGLSVHIIYL